MAILFVLLFHFWPDLFSFGFVGVDIFFVLSGYLITRIIFTRLQNKNFSLAEFYRNRIRRIFPALILVISTSGLLGYLVLFPDELELLGDHILSSAFFYQNINLSREAGYWDTSAQLKPLLHFWSLSIEEQFYLVWPVTVIFIFKFRLQILFGVLLTGFFILSLNVDDDVRSFYLSYSRFWELLLGGFLAHLQVSKRLGVMPRWTHAAGWGVLVLAGWLSTGENVYNPTVILLVAASTGLLIIASSQQSDIFLSSKVLHFLGLISYPLYLWHYPLISFSHILGLAASWLDVYIFSLSVLLAWVTYRFIELPSRRQKSYLFSGTLMLLVIVIGVTGAYIKHKDGLPNRAHMLKLEGEFQQLKRTLPQDGLCNRVVERTIGEERLFHYCRSTSADINANFVAIIGDSHAHMMYPGFSEQLLKEGYEVILLSNTGCPALLGGARGKTLELAKVCNDKINQIYRVLGQLANASKVIISTRGPTYANETGFGEIEKKWTEFPTRYSEYFQDQKNYDASKKFFQSVDDTISFLTGQGREVFYMLENPELGFPAKSCIERPFELVKSRCTVSYDSYLARMDQYRNQSIKLVQKYPLAFILDPETYLCDRLFCNARVNGELMYADGDHLSVEGSRYIASALVPEMIRLSSKRFKHEF